MDDTKNRIVRLIRLLGKPYNEIVGIFWINEEVIVDSISITEDGKDFEMSVFTKVEGSDWETIVPSYMLTEEEMMNIVNILEDILINN